MIKALVELGMLVSAMSATVVSVEPTAIQVEATVEIINDFKEEMTEISEEIEELGLDDKLSYEYLGYEMNGERLTITTKVTVADEVYLWDTSWLYDSYYEEYEDCDALMIYTEDRVCMWYGDDMCDEWETWMESKYPWLEAL